MVDLESLGLEASVLAKYVIGLGQMLEAKNNTERDELVDKLAEFSGKDKEEVYDHFYLYLEDRCKEKVREAVRSENIAKKAYLKTQVLNWLKQFFESKECYKLFDAYSVELKAAETFTLAEMFELAKKQDVNYLVKELIEVGTLLMFSAYAKTGKSMLATYLAMCVAQGKEFLGRFTSQANVLYVQNEERIETTTSPRFYNQGLQNLEAADKLLYNEFIHSNKVIVSRGLDIGLDLKVIFKTAIENDCKLILIDSMRASLKKSVLTDLSPEVPGLLYAMQQECHKHGITVIVIHHSTKLAPKPNAQGKFNKTDLMNGMGGVSGIAGANDGMIFAVPLLEKDSNPPYPVLLQFIPRNGGEINLKIQYVEEEACYWEFQVLEESSMSSENQALQNTILRLLYNRYYQWYEEVGGEIEETEVPVWGHNLNELIQLTDCSRKSVISMLNSMLKREGICRYADVKSKSHIYCIHPSGESWMQIYLRKEDEINEEKQIALELEHRLADQLRATTTKEELENLTKDWTKDLRERVRKHLSAEELNQKYLIIFPPKYSIGEEVLLDKELDPDQKLYKVSYIYYHLESKLIRYKLEGLELDYAESQLYGTDANPDE